MTDPDAPRAPWLAVASLTGIAALVGADLVADGWRGTDLLHVALEALATAIALATGVTLAGRWLRERWSTQQALRDATQRSTRLEAEAAAWRAETEMLAAGLAEAVDRQLVRWGLTEAEREVAWLLLKGLSLKEAAEVRGTSERTTRDQARAVYRKAGLANRAELAAFFLEDLLAAPGAHRGERELSHGGEG